MSKRALRTSAWLAGGVALLAPLGAIVAQPKIAAAQAPATTRTVIVKRVVRRVIVISPRVTKPATRIVYVGGGSSGGSSTSAAAPAPVTSTGGSVPK